MKNHKILFWVLLISFITVFTSYAQQNSQIIITPYSTQLSQGETFQAEILLNNSLAEPTHQNIKLYSSTNSVQQIAIFLSKIQEGHYFLYFEIPTTLQNDTYTLKVENIPFLINNILQQVTQEQPLQISTNSPSLEFNPGYFEIDKATTTQLIIKAESKDINTNINLTTPNYLTHPYISPQLVELNKERSFTLTLNLSNLEEVIQDEIQIIYDSKIFKIPIWVIDTTPPPQPPSPQQSINFLVSDNSINLTIKQDETIIADLELENTLNLTVSNLNLRTEGNISEILKINQTTFSQINPFQKFSIFLEINKEKSPQNSHYLGKIIAENQENYVELPVNINVEFLQQEPTIEEPSIEELISEQQNQSWQVTTNQTEDERKAIDEFIPWEMEPEKSPQVKRTSKALTTLVILLLIMGVAIFILSKKPTTKEKTYKEIIKQTEKRKR
tara:strand:+ start:125 stop:1456 length:1332 start_codon:yes stop_codon:yes gene_type:complete